MPTLQQFAKQLDGKEYDYPMFTKSEIATAKDSGFIIAYSYSVTYGLNSDVLALCGKIEADFYMYDGGEFYIVNGKPADQETYDELEYAVKFVGYSMPNKTTIVVEQTSGEGIEDCASWNISVFGVSEAEQFNILKDGDLFCRACVFKV